MAPSGSHSDEKSRTDYKGEWGKLEIVWLVGLWLEQGEDFGVSD